MQQPRGVGRAGQKRFQPTFTTHAWVVVNPDAQGLGLWVADAKAGKAIVE